MMSQYFRTPWFVFLVHLLCAGIANGEEDLITAYEESGGRITPRYQQTIEYCRQLAAASDHVQYASFGTSPQGRDLPLLVVNTDSNFTAEAVRRQDSGVVVLIEACIHAGESCGKDAGLLLLRDLVVGNRRWGLLDNVTVLFIPIFNVDGHERFGPYNRANQNGPEQMGWRVTAQNLNLNRDFLKADCPEMQAWLRLYQDWLPEFFVDIHSTDGADYQYPITYGFETHGNMDAGLTDWSKQYLVAIEQHLMAAGHPLSQYVGFVERHKPDTGLTTWLASPRFSQGYAAQQNRPGLLIETHMMKPYNIRVDATYQMLLGTLEYLNRQSSELSAAVDAADRHAASTEFRSHPFALNFKRTEQTKTVDFLGVDYEVVDSEISGGQWIRFGSKPTTYTVEMFDEHRPSLTVRLPEAYIIPAEWTEVLDRLALHGVEMHLLTEQRDLEIQTWRCLDPEWRQQPYEGRHPVEFTLEPMTEVRSFTAGSAVIDMNQRTSRLIAHALEPASGDSFIRWGFFDAVFSRVEYIESYTIENLMHQMVVDDPTLLDRLAERKAADPEFAANPWAIRYWFYEQTPYYDQRVGIYPVGTINDPETVRTLLVSTQPR